jgi:malate permease and related proteins
MGGVFVLFYEMLALLVIASIGFLARKYAILPKESNQVITNVILYITLPALILYAMDIVVTSDILVEFILLFGLSIYALGTATIVGYVMRKKSSIGSEQKGVYEALIIFGNQGFIGYAVTYHLFGETGILYTAIFMLLYLFLIWTYAIYLVARSYQRINMKLLLVNPGVLATTLGLVFMMLPVSWPPTVSTLLLTLGEMTMPLSMLLIGSLLAGISLSAYKSILFSKYIWLAMLAKLIIIPMLLLPFLYLPISITVIGVAILVTATPSAPTISMFAEKYGGDAKFAALVVALSTMFCVVTIPLFYGMILWLI